MDRDTGGNRFIAADATFPDFAYAVERGLNDLHRFAAATDRAVDLGAISVHTKRIPPDGMISVTVEGDLTARPSTTT